MKRILPFIALGCVAALCSGCFTRSLYSDELWTRGPTTESKEEHASVSVTNDGRLVVGGTDHYYVFTEFKLDRGIYPYADANAAKDFKFLLAMAGKRHIQTINGFRIYIEKETQAISTATDTGLGGVTIMIYSKDFPDDEIRLLERNGFSPIDWEYGTKSMMLQYPIMTGKRYPAADFKMPDSAVSFSADALSLVGNERMKASALAPDAGAIVLKRILLTPFAFVADVLTYPIQAFLKAGAAGAHMHT